MAYRYLLMFYVHTLLVSIQLRSQYHKKNQVPWCWNHIFGWLSSIWSVQFHCFFSVHPQFKQNDIIFYLIGKLRCFFPVCSPFSILYGFFPQDFLLHRNVCGCQGSGLNRTSYMVKMGHTYIYIHMYNLLTILVYMHTYLYIHTTSSYMSHKVRDTKSNSEDYMITLNKRKTNSRTTVSKVNKPSISTNSKHIEVQTI